MEPTGEHHLEESALAGFPQVAEMLELLVDGDRLVARAVELLVEVTACGQPDPCDDRRSCDHTTAGALREHTGVSLNQLLTIVARRTSSDTRMLHTAATVCTRLPSLHAGFVAGRLSWAQVRAVALICQRMPRRLDDTIDHAIAPVIDQASRLEPNTLVATVRQAIASIDPPTITTPQPAPREFLAMQPRADGHGGHLYAEMGAQAFARLDAALNTPSSPDDEHLHRHDPQRGLRPDNRPDAGQRRLTRLLSLIGTTPTTGAHQSGGMRARPQLLIRADLETLLSRNHTPATLLTRLLGGKAWIDATTTRQLINTHGADLRTVILNTGRIVGVGRRTRIPPGWLHDATLAIHDTCTAPGCEQPARAADLDHATPWHPTPWHPTTDDNGDPIPPGRTDLDQLAPLCPHHNRRKEPDGWTVTQHPDHTRTWTHTHLDLTTTTTPATWQPGTTQPGTTPPGPPAPPPHASPPDASPPDTAREPPGRYTAHRRPELPRDPRRASTRSSGSSPRSSLALRAAGAADSTGARSVRSRRLRAAGRSHQRRDRGR